MGYYANDHDETLVNCDEKCGALLDPKTTEEILKAYEHWKEHASRGGCAHGC